MNMLRADNQKLDEENKKLRLKLKALERHQALEDWAAEFRGARRRERDARADPPKSGASIIRIGIRSTPR